MNTNIKIFFVSLSLFCASAVFAADEPEQISAERYSDHAIHYGLPGWETNLINEGELPQEGNFLHISLKRPQYASIKMKFAGDEYNEITIASSGRIYLGNIPDGFDMSDEARGRFPYVEFTRKQLLPVEKSTTIPVRWNVFVPDQKYAVVEVGPFITEGNLYPMSYQVFFYSDGEIQCQQWIHGEDVAAYSFGGQHLGSPLGELRSKQTLNPVLYNGGHVAEADYGKMMDSHDEYIVSSGKLRPGWIAKSFDNKQTVITPSENGIDVDFGTKLAAGGLFAYDHSREHPVVGGFAYLTVEAYSLSYGYGLDAENAVPVFFWYFGTDSGDLIENAHDANYPYFRDGFDLHQDEIVRSLATVYPAQGYNGLKKGAAIEYDKRLSKSSKGSVIWSAAYMDSWRTVTGNVDETKAIAFKFQTKSYPNGRAIQIRNVSLGLVQPRSVQFFPPLTHKLTFESNGAGYMKGLNFNGKTPYDFVEGSSLLAKIIPAPGDSIEEISINEQLVFKLDGSYTVFPYASANDDGSVDISLPEWPGDARVVAKFKKCETRKLPAVEPSYVKTEVFLDPTTTSRKIEAYSVKDGLGRIVQTQTLLGNDSFSVSATYLDDFGKTEFAPMPYISKKQNFAYEDMYCKQCIAKSSQYHDGSDNLERQFAFNIPYAKEDYHYGDDNGVSKEVAGVAEASFEKWPTSAKQWTIPLATSDMSNFLPEEQLEDADDNLTNIYHAAKKTIVDEDDSVAHWTEYNFKLVVNRSAEGVFTQQIFDAAGNILYAWSKSGEHTVISRTNYNADNQVTSTDISVDNGPFKLATTYVYDNAGRINSVTTPDKGTVESIYNSDDKLRFTRDARQLSLGQNSEIGGNYFSVLEYDGFGRLKRTGEVRGGHSFDDPDTPVDDNKLYILSENFYGKPSMEDLLSTGVTADETLLRGILDEMEGVLENDVGAVAAYDGSRTRSDDSLKANSLKMSSYNRLGQKIRQWTIYGLTGAPATRISYSYNVSGELTSTETAEWKEGSWSPISALAYSYDPHGRLKAVLENGDSLMRIDRTTSGTLSKKAYFDKGAHVYDMTYGTDIYGRTTRLDYKDANGKILYSEIATYPSVVTGRLATAEHIWDGYSSSETYSYDKLGRLASFESDNSFVGNGSYTYDALGRLLSKREGPVGADTTINYVYGDGAFKPLEMDVDNSGAVAYYAYDASGNVWLDRHTGNAYTVNSFGLPDKVRKLEDCNANISFDDVNSDAVLDCEIGRMEMAYDEGGQRIWTDFRVGAPAYKKEVTYPGVGAYSLLSNHPSDALELSRIDLPGGGFRTGISGVAQFPVKDLQGSIRGYASSKGLTSAFGYRPYGTTVDLAVAFPAGEERWQSKEFDGEHGKYYFGARFYDPFFGLWISPDPAGQFANPYSYGGDPLNYVDPTGMWTAGVAGLVIGWDKQHGWSFGFGVGDVITFMFNQDGSKSLNLGVNKQIPIQTALYAELGFSLGFSMNTYSGSNIFASAGVCVGEVGNCVGVESGYNLSWDRSGRFGGMTNYLELYAQLGGGLARISTGYEVGLFGAEGRGMYVGGTIAGVHGEFSRLEDGLDYQSSWGMQERAYFGIGNNSDEKAEDKKTTSMVKWEIYLPSLGNFGHLTFGNGYDVSSKGIRKKELQEDISILEKSSNPEDVEVVKILKFYLTNMDETITTRDFLRIGRALRRNGFEPVERMGDHSDGASKFTFRKAGSREYGQHEFMSNVMKDEAYCSYNYGNNFLTHFLIDYLGWKGRGY